MLSVKLALLLLDGTQQQMVAELTNLKTLRDSPQQRMSFFMQNGQPLQIQSHMPVEITQ
jgi:hypothetical protein